MSDKNTTSESVTVKCRVKPIEGTNISKVNKNVIKFTDVQNPRPSKRAEEFQFDKIFDKHCEQEKVFQDVGKKMCDNALEGYKNCAIAQGVTGSGKTFTIFGDNSKGRIDFVENSKGVGIIPRCVKYLKDRLEEKKGQYQTTISCSFIEIYNDNVYDLGKLYINQHQGEEASETVSSNKKHSQGSVKSNSVKGVPKNSLTKLNLNTMRKDEYKNQTKSDLTGFATVRDMNYIPVDNVTDIQNVLDQCFKQRETAPNYTNVNSSRSHSIFTIHLTMVEPLGSKFEEVVSGDRKTIKGSISFVDLAGCEKFSDKEYSTDQRFEEAVHINSSLTALSRVVLAKTKGEAHVPQRDNKLTRILEPHFETGSIITLMCMMNPTVDNFEFCIETGSFASRCKDITTTPKQDIEIQKADEAEEGAQGKELDPIEEVSEALVGSSLQSEQARLKLHIERIKSETKQATQKEYEQQMQALDGMQRKKFEDLKSILKLDQDLEVIIDCQRNNSRSEALKQLKSKMDAQEELQQSKRKCTKLTEKLDKLNTELQLVRAESKMKEERVSCDLTSTRVELYELQRSLKDQKHQHHALIKTIKTDKEKEIKKVISNSSDIVERNAQESSKQAELYNSMLKMEEDYKTQLKDLQEENERINKEYKANLQTEFTKKSQFDLLNLKKTLSTTQLDMNLTNSKINSEKEQLKNEISKYEKELMMLQKLIKTISSEKYQANSLLFNKELQDKLRPDHLPLLFKILEKKSLNHFLNQNSVQLNEHEKVLPSRPITAKSTVTNSSLTTSQGRFDFNRPPSSRPGSRADFRNAKATPHSNMSSSKNLGRCDSARSLNLIQKSHMASTDDLLMKSQSLHMLNTLVEDEPVQLNNLDVNDMQKQVVEAQEKQKTLLNEQNSLSQKQEALEHQQNLSRLDWKDNHEWRQMEQELNTTRNFMEKCRKNGMKIY